MEEAQQVPSSGLVVDGTVAGKVKGLSAGLVSGDLGSVVTVSGISESRGLAPVVQGSVYGGFQVSEIQQVSSSGLVVDGAAAALIHGSNAGLVSEGLGSAVTVSGNSESRGLAPVVQGSVVGGFQVSEVQQVSSSGLVIAGLVSEDLGSARTVSVGSEPVAEVQVAEVQVADGSVGVVSDQFQGSAALEVSQVSGVPLVSENCLVDVSRLVPQVSEDPVARVLEGSSGLEVSLQSHVQACTADNGAVVAANSGLVGEVGVGLVQSLTGSPSTKVSQKSYLTAAQSRPSLARHDLTLDEGDKCFVVPEEILTNSPPLWEDLIIGN